jgi:hypothetical protein
MFNFIQVMTISVAPSNKKLAETTQSVSNVEKVRRVIDFNENEVTVEKENNAKVSELAIL